MGDAWLSGSGETMGVEPVGVAWGRVESRRTDVRELSKPRRRPAGPVGSAKRVVRTTMAKMKTVPTFDEVLATLGGERFDVSQASEGANRIKGAYRVSRNGCAAEIAPSTEKDAPVRLLTPPGWVLGGEIARLVDRGYQKFFKTSGLEIPATADQLHALHDFREQMKAAAGSIVLYNQALGTTSDRYEYDRLKGR